jgi:hypothetical protein
LIGLPIAFLTYRKTRAEITKLEPEAIALRDSMAQRSGWPRDKEGRIKISISDSRNTRVQVLADSRFLAPLLVLLDFIFAWIVLELAGHFLSSMGLEVIREAGLSILAAVLLVPIARQVLRVRTVLQAPRTLEEVRASQKQARTAGYLFYLIVTLFLLAYGLVVLALASAELTVHRLGWAFVVIGALLIVLIPLAKRLFDGYLRRLHEADSDRI